jgi:predicted transcriptional regulator
MACNTCGGDPFADLGELELTILLVIWRSGAMTAGQVRDELGPPFDAYAVRIALERLEDAGRLAHSAAGDRLIYRAVEPGGVTPGNCP